MWTQGIINGFEFEVKHFDEGSEFGINGGRISKLFIKKAGKIYASFERGWGVHPSDKESKAVYKELIKRYN